MLKEDDKHRLEYQEALNHVFHLDNQGNAFLGISVTAAFAIWAYALQLSWLSWKSVAGTGLGALALVIGYFMDRRVMSYAEYFRDYARDLENRLGMDLLTKFKDHRPAKFTQALSTTIRTIMIISVFTWAFYLIYVCSFWISH